MSELDARQALAHVRNSTVNIDQINLGKDRLIGTGRTDAFKAVSPDPFSQPALVIDSVWAVDEFGVRKEQFVVGEKGKLMVSITNILGDATNASIRISRYTIDSSAIQIDPGSLLLEICFRTKWKTTEGIPFEIRSSSDGITKVRVEISADEYVDYAYEILRIYRPYTIYENSRIKWTLTDRGRTGFDRLEFSTIGEGLTFDGQSQLYEGGVIIAATRSRVLDNVRSDASDDQ